MNNLERLFFCFEIAVVIILSAIFKFVVDDGELLEGSEGKSCNESHSKDAESGSG